ncbi:SDR family NAD(P)-dependent oxidoreductase [Steroidobacter cummioxidans]|uniref:SDR family NAD(P)-dependent oxidoreductase n=1 Tax=Steroidobacter cummioxidans TaxID=1803913 RepID=UPI001581DEA1
MQTDSKTSQKAALVFGGSRGIGAAVAKRLAREGYAVALTYVSRPDKAAEVVASIQGAGGRALAIKADSADPTQITAAVAAAVERFGRLHVAVVSAGLYQGAPLDQFRLETLDRMLSVNVRGVFLAIQAAAAHLSDGGRIITIGSNVAVRSGVVGSSVYAMTKSAVATLVRELALDLAPRRITVNNIQPGPIETDITADFLEALAQRNPLGRVGRPEEVAGLVAYLSGDESGYMTGASLTIDGGFTL